jgi:hypothetical protein
MDNTVVNVESTSPNTINELVRSAENQKNLEMAIDSLKRLLRNENRQREVHKQLDNCFNLVNEYLKITVLEQLKSIKFDYVIEAIKLIDMQLALVVTNADMHDQMIQIISMFSNDVKEVMDKVSIA